MSFNQFVLKQQYEKVQGLGDRLALMKEQINWKKFVPMIAHVFYDNKKEGGRPHTDELVVVRAMVLQECYGLSDQELEFQAHDRLSFMNFLDFPETIPDFSTLWKIRERLQKAGTEAKIWAELQRQMDVKGYMLQKGVIQDATFIEADAGRKRQYKEKQARKKGVAIQYTEKQEQHMDKDGTFSVKHGQVHYGYKNHIKCDVEYHLIRRYKITTASLHDGEVNLVKAGDKAAYRDKGYVGKKVPLGVEDNTMLKDTRGRKLNGGQQKRNRAISSIRAPGERPFAVIKRVFHGGRTYVKTLVRVSIKEMFKCFSYNLYNLVTLERKKGARALLN